MCALPLDDATEEGDRFTAVYRADESMAEEGIQQHADAQAQEHCQVHPDDRSALRIPDPPRCFGGIGTINVQHGSSDWSNPPLKEGLSEPPERGPRKAERSSPRRAKWPSRPSLLLCKP